VTRLELQGAGVVFDCFGEATEALGQRWELDSRGEPSSDQAVRERGHELGWAYLPRWKEQRLFELVDGLAELESVSAIAELLEPVEEGEA